MFGTSKPETNFQFSFPSKLHDMQVAFELSRFLSKIYLFKSWIEALTHNITYILAWIHQIMYIQYMFSLYTRMNSCKMLGRILDAQGNSGAQVALGSWTPLPSLLTLWRWWLQVWQAGNWGAALSLSPQSASVPALATVSVNWLFYRGFGCLFSYCWGSNSTRVPSPSKGKKGIFGSTGKLSLLSWSCRVVTRHWWTTVSGHSAGTRGCC